MRSVWPDRNNVITSITHSTSGSQIVKHSYTYDETNNIVEYLNSIDGNTEYNYDFLGQLISADHASQTDESYAYDSNGNRVVANGDAYTTGTNNELTSDGDYTYTYDAEGNRTSKTNSTNRELYTWDYRNRLTTVMQQEWDSVEQDWTTTQIVEYAYDYNNVWIRKVIGNNKTIFIPENYQTTVQIDNGTVSHHYLWTPNTQDKLLADMTTDGVLWSLTDHLGTIRDIIGDTSTHLTYDAFGNLISGTNPLLFGFTGKAFDTDTNLQNNINRWYDATIGRWLSVDPIGFEGNDTNLYRYVMNNTLGFWDPSGLFTLFGEECVCPWHPEANWDFSANLTLWIRMGNRAAVGTLSGAAAGGATGGIVGLATGAGALPAAGAGAIWGGISGLVDAAVADPQSSYLDTAQRAGINGALSGIIPGGVAGNAAKVTKNANLYSYTYKEISGVFTSSTGRVYFTTTSPKAISQSRLMRLFSTGHWKPFSENYFTVMRDTAVRQEFRPVPLHVTNFWKTFGGQMQTRIGKISFSTNSDHVLQEVLKNTFKDDPWFVYKYGKAFVGTSVEYSSDIWVVYHLKMMHSNYRQENQDILVEFLTDALFAPESCNY